MTNIERMAKEAGWPEKFRFDCGDFSLSKFAALIAEDLAKHCEKQKWTTLMPHDSAENRRVEGMRIAAKDLAQAIRAKYPMPKGEI